MNSLMPRLNRRLQKLNFQLNPPTPLKVGFDAIFTFPAPI